MIPAMNLRTLKAVIKTMRPKQWPKNGFLFAALIFDRQLDNLPALIDTILGFILFSLLSGSVYMLNDLGDLEADRLHPSKRFRPLASGELSTRTAYLTVFLFIGVGFPLAYLLSPLFALFTVVYFTLNLAYTRWLKHIPILDVMVLAGFYVLRVGAGVVLIEVSRFSPWLYVFTTFLALFLGVGKRRAELNLLAEDADSHRRVLGGYSIPLLDQLMTIVSSMTLITYSLYTFSAPNLPDNHTMMLTIPFVIFGIFRYIFLVQIKHSGEAPEDVLLFDRPLQAALLGWGLSVIVIFYLAY
jgi:4-hydroxybenzoate polyprenyltransferase